LSTSPGQGKASSPHDADSTTVPADKRSLALHTAEWFNTTKPLERDALQGKVVMVEAFQMLCPGCVSHGLPQAQRVHNLFRQYDLVVIGLHTVFEHHRAQGQPEVLEAFLHEYKITFPVAVDQPSLAEDIPRTMRAYELRGTPSLLLFNRDHQLVLNHFGIIDDLALGATIADLLNEKPTRPLSPRVTATTPESDACNDSGCEVS
jgi:thiol-disulfide isomerase/thioredoxin